MCVDDSGVAPARPTGHSLFSESKLDDPSPASLLSARNGQNGDGHNLG